MHICIKEIKNIDLFKNFYKSRLFKSIEKIIEFNNYHYGNLYFTINFDEYIFTKKTIHKYEKELITILNYIYENYFKNNSDGDSFFVCKKNENAYFIAINNQFCINGYDYINDKLNINIKN